MLSIGFVYSHPTCQAFYNFGFSFALECWLWHSFTWICLPCWDDPIFDPNSAPNSLRLKGQIMAKQKNKTKKHPTLGFAFAKLFWPWLFTMTLPALLGQVKTSMAWKMVEKKIKVKVKCMQLSFKSKRWLERQVSEIKQVNNRTLWVTGLYLDGCLPVPFSVSVH